MPPSRASSSSRSSLIEVEERDFLWRHAFIGFSGCERSFSRGSWRTEHRGRPLCHRAARSPASATRFSATSRATHVLLSSLEGACSHLGQGRHLRHEVHDLWPGVREDLPTRPQPQELRVHGFEGESPEVPGAHWPKKGPSAQSTAGPDKSRRRQTRDPEPRSSRSANLRRCNGSLELTPDEIGRWPAGLRPRASSTAGRSHTIRAGHPDPTFRSSRRCAAFAYQFRSPALASVQRTTTTSSRLDITTNRRLGPTRRKRSARAREILESASSRLHDSKRWRASPSRPTGFSGRGRRPPDQTPRSRTVLRLPDRGARALCVRSSTASSGSALETIGETRQRRRTSSARDPELRQEVVSRGSKRGNPAAARAQPSAAQRRRRRRPRK